MLVGWILLVSKPSTLHELYGGRNSSGVKRWISPAGAFAKATVCPLVGGSAGPGLVQLQQPECGVEWREVVISGLGRRDQDTGGGLQRPEMFATAARWVGKKGKPKMGPIELTAAPEQAQSITRTIFDVVREHGPLTITDVWEHVKGVGLRGLTSKRQMKIMLRWMRERQKLRLICDHDGPHKQFLYTTWFTNPKNAPQGPQRELKGEHPKP